MNRSELPVKKLPEVKKVEEIPNNEDEDVLNGNATADSSSQKNVRYTIYNLFRSEKKQNVRRKSNYISFETYFFMLPTPKGWILSLLYSRHIFPHYISDMLALCTIGVATFQCSDGTPKS